MVTEMFQSVLILTTATVYVVFADITIECPQCTHISADLDDDSWIPLAAINTIRNEACVAYPFDPTADGISLVQCTAAVNQVAKCVSFDGLVNTDLSILGIVAMNTHIKYCAVVDIDPGNVCEHTEGDENSGTDLSQQITQAMSILNFLGDDSFSGRLCYSDGFRQPDYKTITCPQCGHITTDATSIPSALLALFQNEACVAVPFDASAEGIDEVQCTPMGNQVAKCVSFDGEVDASLIVTTVSLTTHLKDCTYVDVDPGNRCEDVSGDEDTTSGLGQMISRVMSALNLFGSETFTGRLCYYGDNTSAGAFHSYGTVVLTCIILFTIYFEI